MPRAKQVFGFCEIWLLMGLLFVLAACAGSSLPQTEHSPTATAHLETSPSPFGGAAAQLGPLPRNCPPGPLPREIPSITWAVGTFPVWTAFSQSPLSLGWTPKEARQFHTPYGWSHKLLWIVDAGYKELVTLRGANLQDGVPLMPVAEDAVSESTLTTLVLNPQNPVVPAERHIDHWIEFPGGLTVPRAGCYRLTATWSGGNWQIPFAAGEISAS